MKRCAVVVGTSLVLAACQSDQLPVSPPTLDQIATDTTSAETQLPALSRFVTTTRSSDALPAPMSDRAAATGNLRRDHCVGSVDPSGVWVDRWDVPNKTLTFNFLTDPVGVIALSLSPDGPFTSSLSVTVTTDANGSGRTPFYIKSIATGTAILDGPGSEEYGWVCVAY